MGTAYTYGMRKCLGYDNFECDKDITGSAPLTKRCDQCSDEFRKQSGNDRSRLLHSRTPEFKILNCTSCGQTLSAECFGWVTKAHESRQHRCKKCVNKAWAKWSAENPDKVRESKMARDLRASSRRLGFDPEVIKGYYLNHSGLCDICGRSPEEADRSRRRLCIDHDHASKEPKFRGFICFDCNLLLGDAHDDPNVLMAAAEYLKNSFRKG